MSKTFWLVVVLASCPVISEAQAPAVNPVYRRAQTMVNDGNATTGRALVDSMIAIAAPGSNDYAEGVYWRAVLAATAATAEMDYRRIVIDYPLSLRVEDALIRLAQLEIARGNYDGALRHLNRLVAEHPQSAARPRAAYWTARALFDKNDVQGGCAATATALAITSEGDSELRNQIAYLNQRCAGVVIAQAPPATVPATPIPATPIPVTSTSVTTAPAGSGQVINPPPSQVINPPVQTTTTPIAPPPAGPGRVIVDSVRAPVTVTAAPTIVPPSAPPVSEPVSAPVTTSTIPAPPRPRATSVKPSVDEALSAGEKVWSVQVAAYNLKSQADAMVARLKSRGYEARVDGKVKPFRVRIGRYSTQSQAAAVQRSLKAKQIEGYVVPAETQ